MDSQQIEIDKLKKENKEISAKLALKCTAEWDNGYKSAFETYLKKQLALEDRVKKIQKCLGEEIKRLDEFYGYVFKNPNIALKTVRNWIVSCRDILGTCGKEE